MSQWTFQIILVGMNDKSSLLNLLVSLSFVRTQALPFYLQSNTSTVPISALGNCFYE